MLVLGFDCWVKKPCYRWKTSLVVGGNWTRVLADSMAIAAIALNHWQYWPIHRRSSTKFRYYIFTNLNWLSSCILLQKGKIVLTRSYATMLMLHAKVDILAKIQTLTQFSIWSVSDFYFQNFPFSNYSLFAIAQVYMFVLCLEPTELTKHFKVNRKFIKTSAQPW